ncbi:MAG: hypothetical protein DMF62_12785 [Acidobacteria bacterium]|nr:MAG: hypothetical protein DMF62_12785 [Acidobacteriota bacterium]
MRMMMKETKDVIACVVDHGMVGLPMAERLARDMKHVYFFSHWEEGQPTFSKAIVGDGLENVERCLDIWQVKDEVDLFVFPDVQESGLQLELEAQGKTVWGSRGGDVLELDREVFLKTIREVGLLVPPHEIIVGVAALREFLKEKKDYYIKMSLFRGSFETMHYRSWKLDACWLDGLGVRFGPFAVGMRFLCFPNIETPLEIGADTFCVDSKFPSLMLHGVEWKDRAYFGAVTQLANMPRQVREVLKAFGPVLGKERYRNQFSCEVRVKGDKSYFIDPTCRFGLPSTGSQLELWKNWSDIVWHGANGVLIEPIAAAKYSAEAIVKMGGEHTEWRVVDIPTELKPWLKLADYCEYDGMTCFPTSDSPGGDEVGWLVAIGQTPEETIKKLNKHADMLPDGMDANTECLAYVLKEIQQLRKQGIKFGSDPIPSPGLVMVD